MYATVCVFLSFTTSSYAAISATCQNIRVFQNSIFHLKFENSYIYILLEQCMYVHKCLEGSIKTISIAVTIILSEKHQKC